jgi:hypothetical protein
MKAIWRKRFPKCVKSEPQASHKPRFAKPYRRLKKNWKELLPDD